MEKESVRLEKINLVGITTRTSNKDEVNPVTAKIFPCIQRYDREQVAKKINHRKNPGVVFCVYTNYESDHTGPYTYFIGEEVTSEEDIPSGLETLTISSQEYAKFTTEPGPMPFVVINAWQKIWHMTAENLGERRYHADFEVYDQRAQNFQSAVVDIYIGLNK